MSEEASQDRALGRLEGKIDMMLAAQEKADVARKAQYDKLDALDRKVEATEAKVESIDRRLESVEEPVAEFSRWRERGVGALMLITFISASVGATAAAFWKKAVAIFTGG